MGCWEKAFNKVKRSPTPCQALGHSKCIKAFNKLMRSPPTHQTSEDSKCKVPSDPSPTTTHLMLMESIDRDLSEISQESQSLQEYYTRLNTRLGKDLEKLRSVYSEIKSLGEDELEKELKEFKRKLMKLKLMSPSKYKIGANIDGRDKNLLVFKQLKTIMSVGLSKKMPQLHGSDVFERSMEFKDFEARYEELHDCVKLCLLCFSIFPEGAVVKKRLMLQWWVAEGFASSDKDAGNNFEELMDMGFIERVGNNRSLSASSCRLHPFHRSALIMLAERARLFNFESGGVPSLNFSGSFQACLKGGADCMEHSESKKEIPVHELDKLHLLLNLSEQNLESIDEWFPKMRNLNFLYLGRWKESASHHIVLNQESNLMNYEGMMQYVKFLSLQGITNITLVPLWILQLKNLEVLDLRCCSSLVGIPDRIQDLERLTHLDMSDCSMLEYMPKGLSRLKRLKVLKGFFIGGADYDSDSDSKRCTLKDLQLLKNLDTLCIKTDLEYFPLDRHVAVLHNLISLTKLTIDWGFNPKSLGQPSPTKYVAKLPPNLKKLHLKSFPMSATPYWLKLKNLQGIKLHKLCISRGKLRDLGQYDGDDKKWTVEVLRLKYLGEMEMEWRQFQQLFPKLKYLEKLSCPKLTFFPCDAKGVWINAALPPSF